MPFVLLSPSPSVLKSPGFINIATAWEEVFNQVFVVWLVMQEIRL